MGTAATERLRGTPKKEDALSSRPGRLAAAIATSITSLLLVTAPASAATDPELASAWHLAGDAPMGAVSAWAQTAGAGQTVAVLDTGVDPRHPDLQGALWTDPATGAHGIDLVDGDLDPSDEHGHGTHVAGIIAARAGNGVGAAGIAPQAQVMAVRVLDAQAAGDASTVADGVRWAVAHGARVLNLSLAGPVESPELERAIAAAADAGALVVAAAGNQGSDLGLLPAFPANSSQPNVLAVAASDEDGLLAPVSNFGGSTDLSAPGASILATALGGGSELRTGTSMSAPLVAGTAALVRSVRPDATYASLSASLRGGARSTGLPVGAGALDAAGALRTVIDARAWRTARPAAPASAAAQTPAGTAKRVTTKKTKTKKKQQVKRRPSPRKKAKKRATTKRTRTTRTRPRSAKGRAKARPNARASQSREPRFYAA